MEWQNYQELKLRFGSADKVKNIVFIGAVAQNLSKIAELQGVNTILRYAKEVIDHNHDGLISVPGRIRLLRIIK